MMIFDDLEIPGPKLSVLTVKQGRTTTVYRFLNPASLPDVYKSVVRKSEEYKHARKRER